MFATIRASTALHNSFFHKIINSPLQFFETTPSGRIQNIFSRDVDESEFCLISNDFLRRINTCWLICFLTFSVDNYLPISIENMVQNIFTCSFAILFICAVLHWFILPLFVFGVLFFIVSKFFR